MSMGTIFLGLKGESTPELDRRRTSSGLLPLRPRCTPCPGDLMRTAGISAGWTPKEGDGRDIVAEGRPDSGSEDCLWAAARRRHSSRFDGSRADWLSSCTFWLTRRPASQLPPTLLPFRVFLYLTMTTQMKIATHTKADEPRATPRSITRSMASSAVPSRPSTGGGGAIDVATGVLQVMTGSEATGASSTNEAEAASPIELYKLATIVLTISSGGTSTDNLSFSSTAVG
mmetsp:Transcript_2149/g.4387  ORF Transcript_2149/g.4387 Transcript_2149/m.4387 type:complete len:229 (+) Transcript_2149:673-1359(+)